MAIKKYTKESIYIVVLSVFCIYMLFLTTFILRKQTALEEMEALFYSEVEEKHKLK